MNIAHVVPHSVTFPLKAPNGRYNFVYELACEQVRAGHKVTLYSHPDSDLKDEGVTTQGIATDEDAATYDSNSATFLFALSHSHDIYHSHFDSLHYDIAPEANRPIVFTQHWWPSSETIQKAALAPGHVYAIPPTRHMLEFDAGAGIKTLGYIHHGIDLSKFTPNFGKRNNRLLFVGRISPEKDLRRAISIAKQAQVGLDIVGELRDKNIDYWNSLKANIDGYDIRYLGPKNQVELAQLYNSASALLFTSYANEAFGMVVIEAQACGTPVITINGGARSELVLHRKTGFLCDSDNDFVIAITKGLYTLDAKDRISFAQHFSKVTMATNYTKMYKQVLNSTAHTETD